MDLLISDIDWDVSQPIEHALILREGYINFLIHDRDILNITIEAPFLLKINCVPDIDVSVNHNIISILNFIRKTCSSFNITANLSKITISKKENINLVRVELIYNNLFYY